MEGKWEKMREGRERRRPERKGEETRGSERIAPPLSEIPGSALEHNEPQMWSETLVLLQDRSQTSRI